MDTLRHRKVIFGGLNMIKQRKEKILITNAYAVNNGDMALAIALYQSLKHRGFDVSIATFYYKFLKEQYPNVSFVRELLDYKFPIGATFLKKAYLKLNYVFNTAYRSYDVYIGSPGGYMNSYYGLKKCLLPKVEAKKNGEKTAVYAQSVGPLNEKDVKLLNTYSKSIDVLVVRDDYSRKTVEATNCQSTVMQTKDAAFLLEPRTSKGKNSNVVGVSVRSWKHDNRSNRHFYDLIKSFCKKIIDQGLDIEFISTCQGVAGYVDDSEVALDIKNELVEENQLFEKRISVDTSYHTYFELIEILNTKYRFVIGTRLHMCILSLINGAPAFNISYEIKGKECYDYLGLSNYSVDFNAPIEQSIGRLVDFIANEAALRNDMHDKIIEAHEESHADLGRFLSEMGLH